VLDGNIRDNIALVPNMSKVFDSRMIEILQRVKLEKLITQGNLGLDTRIGEGGILLSGGEKQRLGMARAIFSNAQLIVFDESTSSLDVITENAVAEIFHSLKGICTVVVIAHRLSTIRNFDQIAYLSSGEVRAITDFNSLRNLIKDFDDQCVALDIR
jgi:ABC-type multidrug transport system fused ATPase/permease subunit